MKHYYQPDQYSCVQGSAAILLSFFGIDKTPEEIISEVPPRSWPDRPELVAGTPNQDIASYFLSLGFDVTILSFDTWITDQSWKGKTNEQIMSRLQAGSGKLTAPAIGRSGSELYIQGYIDFVKSGGTINVDGSPRLDLIESLTIMAPIITTVAFNTLYSDGKSIAASDRSSTYDDVEGLSPNHNIVITRIDGDEVFYFDSWKDSSELSVHRDVMIAAISAAQQECDNMFIIVRDKANDR